MTLPFHKEKQRPLPELNDGYPTLLEDDGIQIHHLFIHKRYWKRFATGAQSYDVKGNGRHFQKGDLIVYYEVDPEKGLARTGRILFMEIPSVTNYRQKDDNVVIGLKLIRETNDIDL